jgi:hypothetical protein
VLAGYALTEVWELGCNWAFQSVYENLGAVSRHPWTWTALLRILGMVGNALCDCALSLACAWVVMRVHRAHRYSVLFTFVALQAAEHLPGLLNLAAQAGSGPGIAIPLAAQIILVSLHAVTTTVAGLWVYRLAQLSGLPLGTRIFACLWGAQILATAVVFSAHRVGVITWSWPPAYLSLYGLEAVCGVLLAWLLWRPRQLGSSPLALRSQPALVD